MNTNAPQQTAPAAAVPARRAPTAMEVVCTGVKAMEPQFAAALPKGVSVERFTRTALQGIQTHQQKDKLLTADRQSLYNACSKAASDGLQLDGREAALVVFADAVTYMPMTQGLVKLARNSGEIKNIMAEVVYSKDKFSFDPGTDDKPRFSPDWFSEDRGEPLGAYALITLDNGEFIHAILSKTKIMKIASKSKNQYQYDPQKGLYFDEWWKKTAIKNVLKYAPKSTELESALSHDEEEFIDNESGNIVSMPASAPKAPKPRKNTVADAVKEAAQNMTMAPAATPEPAAQPQAQETPQPPAQQQQPQPSAAQSPQQVQDAEFTEEVADDVGTYEDQPATAGGEEIPLM